MAKTKLVCNLDKVAKPKDVENCKRIFLNTEDEIMLDIAVCMFDAYKTPDSDLNVDDFKHEIKLLMRGEYGDWCENASLYYKVNEVVAGAVFVSIYDGVPLLTYLFTRKVFLGDAVASQLFQVSAYVLKLLKHTQMHLYIDDNDSQSYNLYRTMGFVAEEKPKPRKGGLI